MYSANTGGGYERTTSPQKEHQMTWQEEYLSNMKTLAEQAREYAWQTAEDVQYALGESIFAGIKGKWEDIGDAIESVLDSILRNISNMFASQIMRQFMDWFGKGIGGLFGTGGPNTGGGYIQGQGLVVGTGANNSTSAVPTKAFVPKSYGSSVQKSNTPPEVHINHINQTGIPSKATVKSTQFDGKRYVVNVLTEALADNTGGIRDLVMSRG
jgi:phage-related minor tail protein